MTPAVVPHAASLCRVSLKKEGSWLNLGVSLTEPSPQNILLRFSEDAECAMTGLDDLARGYTTATWQGGIISGARFAFRRLHVPPRTVCVHELRGALSSADIGAIAAAAELAVTKLLEPAAEPSPSAAGWESALIEPRGP